MNLHVDLAHASVRTGASRRDILDRNVDVARREMGMAQSIVQGINVIGVEEFLAVLVKPDPRLAVLYFVDAQLLRPREFEYQSTELRLSHIGHSAHAYRINHSSENCFALATASASVSNSPSFRNAAS
ncbi:hypothetical protein ACMZ49_23605, partial [Alcaligenes phenolicus]